MNQREYTIDFLKFFAALLITNSHLEVFDPTYPFATGGSIGDVLFFFCSGYTLFMGRMGRFDNWYKRRLNRIFPPVICWGIIAAFCFDSRDSIDRVIVNGGGWFVQCILLYYILAYPIRKYAIRYLSVVFCSVAIFTCIWFLLQHENIVFLYGWNYCKWVAFFLFFLQGAYEGLHPSLDTRNRYGFWITFCALLGCVLVWYGILYVQQAYQLPNIIQLFSLFPLLGISCFFFRWCKSNPMKNLFYHRLFNPVFRFIGGLCFEIYLVQYTLFNHIHLPVSSPFNIIIIWLLIFLWAYLLRVFTNFFTQTIKEQDYEWRRLFRVY